MSGAMTLWKALHDYNLDGGNSTDLAFTAGTIIRAAPNPQDPGWLYGYAEHDPTKQQGEVPANFVEPYEEEVEQDSPPPAYSRTAWSEPEPAPEPEPEPEPEQEQEQEQELELEPGISAPASRASFGNFRGLGAGFDADPGSPQHHQSGDGGNVASWENPAFADEQLPCPDGIDYFEWKNSYTIDQQHEATLEINMRAFARQVEREKQRREQGLKRDGKSLLHQPTADDPLLRLAPSAVNLSRSPHADNTGRSGRGATIGTPIHASAGPNAGRSAAPPDEEEAAALRLARQLQMEEIQRAHGGRLGSDAAMDMLASALENGGLHVQESEPATIPHVADDGHEQIPHANVLSNETVCVKYINRVRVQLERAIMLHDSKQRFKLVRPGQRQPIFEASVTSYGNFVIFGPRGQMVARLDCLPNKVRALAAIAPRTRPRVFVFMSVSAPTCVTVEYVPVAASKNTGGRQSVSRAMRSQVQGFCDRRVQVPVRWLRHSLSLARSRSRSRSLSLEHCRTVAVLCNHFATCIMRAAAGMVCLSWPRTGNQIS